MSLCMDFHAALPNFTIPTYPWEKSCNLHQRLLYMQVEGTNPLIAGL